MSELELASCFSGPNALIDVSGYFDLSSARMTALQLASFREDRVRLSSIIDNRNTHFSSSPGSIFPTPLHLCCMWKLKPRLGNDAGNDPCRNISYGSVSCAEMLLLHGADPNGLLDATLDRLRIGTVSSIGAKFTSSSNGDEDILCASRRGSIVERDENPTKSSSTSIRPLHLALFNNNTALVKLLLLHGAEIRPLEKMCLWCCATSWSIGGLAMLASVDEPGMRRAASDPSGLNTDDHQTAMHVALLNDPREEYCMANSEVCEHVERLIHFLDLVSSFGCPVNAQDARGNTALHYAWRYGNAQAAIHLVEVLHADPAIKNDEGATPFHYHPSQLPSAAVLLSGLTNQLHLSSSWKVMHQAALALLRYDPEAVVGRSSPSPWLATTALHVLSEGFSSLKEMYPADDLVALAVDLLQHSPNAINLPNERGLTPLLIACSSPCTPDFVDSLLVHGGDPRTTTAAGLTCLQQLLCLTEPYPGIGDVALSLVVALGEFDVNDLSQSPSSSKPFLDAHVVRTHPYWQSFYEAVSPPKTEKEKREREASRFYHYANNASGTAQIIGELSSALNESAVSSRYAAFVERRKQQQQVEQDEHFSNKTTLVAEVPSGPLGPSCEAAISTFQCAELNAIKYDPRRQVTDDDGYSFPADKSLMCKGLPVGHVLVILLRERAEEEELRRQCLEDSYVTQEMRRQHQRTLQFAAARHAHLPKIVNQHYCHHHTNGSNK